MNLSYLASSGQAAPLPPAQARSAGPAQGAADMFTQLVALAEASGFGKGVVSFAQGDTQMPAPPLPVPSPKTASWAAPLPIEEPGKEAFAQPLPVEEAGKQDFAAPLPIIDHGKGDWAAPLPVEYGTAPDWAAPLPVEKQAQETASTDAGLLAHWLSERLRAAALYGSAARG